MAKRSNHTPEPALNQLARNMVGSIDCVLDYLMMAVTLEDVDGEIELTLQEVRATKSIAAKGSTTMSALASSLGVSLPTATHLVDRLVTKGLTVRARSEQDRRLVLVTLSEQAKARQRAFFDKRAAVICNILEPLDPAERQRVVKALGELARVVETYAAGHVKTKTPHENHTRDAVRRLR